ncbi:hypothetical protein TNCV_4115481 [Trichonephila clavipes]|nr:hypothetical protein TNCV_4115481 [Trichonephila clavipes]
MYTRKKSDVSVGYRESTFNMRYDSPEKSNIAHGTMCDALNYEGSAHHCSSKEAQSVARVLGVGLRAVIRSPRAFQAFTIGLRSGDRAGHCVC